MVHGLRSFMVSCHGKKMFLPSFTRLSARRVKKMSLHTTTWYKMYKNFIKSIVKYKKNNLLFNINNNNEKNRGVWWLWITLRATSVWIMQSCFTRFPIFRFSTKTKNCKNPNNDSLSLSLSLSFHSIYSCKSLHSLSLHWWDISTMEENDFKKEFSVFFLFG